MAWEALGESVTGAVVGVVGAIVASPRALDGASVLSLDGLGVVALGDCVGRLEGTAV